MSKPILQKEARAVKRQLAKVEATLLDEVLELRAMRETWIATRAERDKLKAELEAARTYGNSVKLRLGAHKHIASWRDAPATVVEAVRVASHLGRKVLFAVRDPEVRPSYAYTGEWAGGVEENLPAELPSIEVYAYETL